MISLVTDFILFIWSIRICMNLLSYIQLWYVKEYRVDRVIIHLKTAQGKRILFPQWRRPPVRTKTIVLFVSSLLFIILAWLILPFQPLIKLLIIDVLEFPIIAILVAFLKLPTAVYHFFLIRLAIQKLRKHAHMTVVGITGSYGKTSTKEIAAAILSQSHHVLKTPVSKNSPIAIAECILQKLTSQHDVFIVEMGAYKKGEIAYMSQMVKPEIGVITAINEQHQDLFGNIETTMKAKYELIAGLSGRNISIFNKRDLRVVEMSTWAKRDKKDVWFYYKGTPEATSEKIVYATDISSHESTISSVVHYKHEKAPITVPFIEEHLLENVLAAITIALVSGMSFEDVITGCSRIKAIEKIMQPIDVASGALYIDDTFNNNPDAAIAALSYLAKRKGRKLLVFQPMIELGEYAGEAHKKVGAVAGKICDDIILTNDNFFESFLVGAKESHAQKNVHVMNEDNAAAFIRDHAKKGSTVLFKGKESAKVLRKLC